MEIQITYEKQDKPRKTTLPDGLGIQRLKYQERKRSYNSLRLRVIEKPHDLHDPRDRVRYIMLENSSIMLLSVTQKNLVLCPKLCSKNIALCSPDFYCIQHVLITAV